MVEAIGLSLSAPALDTFEQKPLTKPEPENQSP